MKTLYEAKDGRVFNSERGCLDHERILDGWLYKCPACKGRGRIVTGSIQTNTEPEEFSFGNIGWRPQYDEVTEHCRACDGEGYSKTPFKEVTKVVHSHWERTKGDSHDT